MNEKHNCCKIVQDLLPSYIEKLTDEETNKFIEEHIDSCDQCKRIYDELLNSNNEKEKTITKKEIKYMKKYKNKMYILKVILLIILIFAVIYVGRNMIIIGSMQNKAIKYYDSNNYHIEFYSYSPEMTTLLEVYKKDDKSMQKSTGYGLEDNAPGILTYTNKDIGTHIYYIDQKVLGTTNECIEPWLKVQSINYIQTQNVFDFIRKAVMSKITTVECNGKECYKVDDWNITLYIDKETGLTTRVLNTTISFSSNNPERKESSAFDLFYEFDNVTDEDFIEPNTTGFEKVDI